MGRGITSPPQIIPPDGGLRHLARIVSRLLINLVEIPSREIRKRRRLSRAPLPQIVEVALSCRACTLGTCPLMPQYVPPLEILPILSLLERQIFRKGRRRISYVQPRQHDRDLLEGHRAAADPSLSPRVEPKDPQLT